MTQRCAPRLDWVLPVRAVARVFAFRQDDPAGKQELTEVVENLRHWKENCAALGYDSDGEQLSEEATQGSAEGVNADGASGSERREKEVRTATEDTDLL